MTRPYKLKRRAANQEETRRRIIEATIELHETVGPAATTVTEIAERAGVGRVTVYRHFPDELTLSHACSGLYFERHPAPDIEAWRAIPDARERLRTALAETYAYHRSTEAMIGNALADARDHTVMQPYHEHWGRAVDVLAAPWQARGNGRKQLRGAIALALGFATWRTLTREHGLSDDQAVEVALRLSG